MDASSVALFSAALGLTDPWTVVRIEFSPEQGQLDLWLDCKRPTPRIFS